MINDKVFEDLKAGLATAAVMMIDSFVNHPVATISALVGLLYIFERWRTQRIEYSIKKIEHKKLLKEKENEGSS